MNYGVADSHRPYEYPSISYCIHPCIVSCMWYASCIHIQGLTPIFMIDVAVHCFIYCAISSKKKSKVQKLVRKHGFFFFIVVHYIFTPKQITPSKQTKLKRNLPSQLPPNNLTRKRLKRYLWPQSLRLLNSYTLILFTHFTYQLALI